MLRETHYCGGGKMFRAEFCWDMVKNDSVIVPHTLDFRAIMLISDRPIEVTITDDTEKLFSGLLSSGGGITLGERAFELWRPKRGMYDGPNYDDPEVVRGVIQVLYKNKP